MINTQNKEDFMIWEDVLAKFKELFGDEGEIGVYFAPGTCEHDR